MKLNLTAAAILALGSGMVSAQTAAPQASVTVYGNLDLAVTSQSTSAAGYAPNGARTADTGAVMRLQDGGIGGSNFGIKGSADVGGGLKANVQLQGNVNVDTGSGNAISGALPAAGAAPSTALFNQIATVGLSGSLGEIKLGRQITPLYYAMVSTDGREGRYSGSILGSLVGMNSAAGWAGQSTNAPLGAIYDDNSIVYTTPTMNGFTGNLQYTIGEIPGNNAAASRRSATLLYSDGPLKLSAAYYSANDAYTLPANANGTLNNQFYHVGAKYDLSAYTFSASYSNGKNPSGLASGVGTASPASANANYDVIHAGLGYKISPEYRITSGYYLLRDVNDSTNKSALLAVGLDRYFDKQTMVYVMYGTVANEGNMNQGVIYGAPVASGVTTNAFMVGLRRSF